MALVTSALQTEYIQTPRDVIRTCGDMWRLNALKVSCITHCKDIANERILQKQLTPVFAKYDMEYKCEMVDTVPFPTKLSSYYINYIRYGIYHCVL